MPVGRVLFNLNKLSYKGKTIFRQIQCGNDLVPKPQHMRVNVGFGTFHSVYFKQNICAFLGFIGQGINNRHESIVVAFKDVLSAFENFFGF